MIRGYCMRCKGEVDIRSPIIRQLANGTYMLEGYCINCGTKVTKILSKEEVEIALDNGAKKEF